MEKKRADRIIRAAAEKWDLEFLGMVDPSKVPEEVWSILNKLDDLWYIYGNNGPKHTYGNHRFVQEIVNQACPEYLWEVYSKLNEEVFCHVKSATVECRDRVDALLVELEEEVGE